MLHRVEFEVYRPGSNSSSRFAVDVDADSGDDAAAKGVNEAARIANGGGFKVVSIYPVAPGTPLREGLARAEGSIVFEDVGVEADGIPEKLEPPQVEESEVDALRSMLDGMGKHYDKRWGVEKLKAALADAV
jgi:hypothetical protein